MVELVTAHCYRVWLRDPVSGLTWSPTIVGISETDATTKALGILSRCEVLRFAVLHATSDHGTVSPFLDVPAGPAPQRTRGGRRVSAKTPIA